VIRSPWRVVPLAVALLLAPTGCGLWGAEGGPGGTGIEAPPSSSVTPVVAVAGPDGVQRVEITMGDDLRFTPTSVRARTGPVEFVFRNVGVTAHDVQAPSGPATGNLNGGASQTVRVTISSPGTYAFPCLYHLSSGMQGTLEVVA
jgi:plastocyanin